MKGSSNTFKKIYNFKLCEVFKRKKICPVNVHRTLFLREKNCGRTDSGRTDAEICQKVI